MNTTKDERQQTLEEMLQVREAHTLPQPFRGFQGIFPV